MINVKRKKSYITEGNKYALKSEHLNVNENIRQCGIQKTCFLARGDFVICQILIIYQNNNKKLLLLKRKEKQNKRKMIYPIYPTHITTNVGLHSESLLYVHFQRQLFFKGKVLGGTVAFRSLHM